MKRIYSEAVISQLLEQNHLVEHFSDIGQFSFQAIVYEKGELVFSPVDERQLFQFMVEGSISIYHVREDGTFYSLAQSDNPYAIGDMELFLREAGNAYAESVTPVLCLALSIAEQREKLLGDAKFMAYIAEGLAKKLHLIARAEAVPCSLPQRVINYLRYRMRDHCLKGLEKTAFQLHCSPRQLQRVLNELAENGQVEKVGKGAYRLTE